MIILDSVNFKVLFMIWELLCKEVLEVMLDYLELQKMFQK